MQQKNTTYILLIFLLLTVVGCSLEGQTEQPAGPETTSIAFGSCGWQDHPLPIFNRVVEHAPDLFIFLGDNIYGDTESMDTLRAKYERLAAKSSFQNLRANVPILATWDDHDYGWNDIGKHYPYKAESKKIFLEFWNEPADSPRRDHPGIYHSYLYEKGGYKLQIILLDERTFRDDLKENKDHAKGDRRFSFYKQDYAPHTSTEAEFLGEEQWKWLEKELRKEADVRIIGSGSQFSIEWNGYEAWANFPHEQQRMIDLIAETKANGVIFISGDVHYAEISKLETAAYPIYDFTSSGLSSTWHFATPNKNRIEGPVMDNHFGLITIDWKGEETTLKMETWDVTDNQRFELTVPISSLMH